MFINNLLILDLFLAKSRGGKIRESNLCEKDFDKVLGLILTNSKNWNKGRLLGNKNANKDENDDTTETDRDTQI